MSLTVTHTALAALVLVAFALAMSRRSLALSAGLCFLALGFIMAGFVAWARF